MSTPQRPGAPRDSGDTLIPRPSVQIGRPRAGNARAGGRVTDHIDRAGSGRFAMPTAAVGNVVFMVRTPLGGGRMLTEADAEALVDFGLPAGATLRGSLCIAGPPAHNLGDLFFQDLPSAAGAIWRALGLVVEPDVCMDVTLESDDRVMVLEHIERSIDVTVVDTAGNLQSRRRYDPFALVDSVVSACERLEKLLRTRGVTAAWQALHRHYARPAFPRILPASDDAG
jgi:hypothetical protein